MCGTVQLQEYEINMNVLFYSFFMVVSDLEMKMQTLITSIFSTVYSVEEGVRLLDIFEPLSSREVPQTHLPAFTKLHFNFLAYCTDMKPNIVTRKKKRKTKPLSH